MFALFDDPNDSAVPGYSALADDVRVRKEKQTVRTTTFGLAAAALVAAATAPVLARDWGEHGKDWALAFMSDRTGFVFVEKWREGHRAVYEDAIRNLCVPGQWCDLHFWSRHRHLPTHMPLTEEQDQERVGQYLPDPVTGQYKLLLLCKYRLDDKEECFEPGQMTKAAAAEPEKK